MKKSGRRRVRPVHFVGAAGSQGDARGRAGAGHGLVVILDGACRHDEIRGGEVEFDVQGPRDPDRGPDAREAVFAVEPFARVLR